LWVALIAQAGLLAAALAVGIAMVAIVWPLAARFLRAGPADLGLQPDGRGVAASAPEQPPKLARSALLRDPRFTTLSTAFALGLFAQIGL
ncbi:hypothetical protein, partial [Stenotrophomonas maltophilia]|uniref:hypothetical protein n=1 Tax=Stenotrophomonas maltophilia TaxID=40324 RepID=UPI0019549721